MKEYAIFCRIKKGKPFIISNNTNKSMIISKLYELIHYEDIRGKSYFVDNDFFHNIYIQLNADKYYCIKEREITDWQTYSKENENKIKNNKILYFHNFVK